MPRTKRQIIEDAHIEIGVQAFEQQPEDVEKALRALDDMMADLDARGANTGYAAGSGLDDDAGLPMDALRGVRALLAIEVAPSFGKSPMPATLTAAQQGRNLLMRKNADIPERVLDYSKVPAGAGHKYARVLTPLDTTATPEERNG